MEPLQPNMPATKKESSSVKLILESKPELLVDFICLIF